MYTTHISWAFNSVVAGTLAPLFGGGAFKFLGDRCDSNSAQPHKIDAGTLLGSKTTDSTDTQAMKCR